MADAIPAPIEDAVPPVDAPAAELPILRAVATADDAMQARAAGIEASVRAAMPTDQLIDLALQSWQDPAALEVMQQTLATMVEEVILPAVQEAEAEAEVLGAAVGDAVEGM